jgi:hypothetical protein
MNIKASGRSALILVTGLFVCFAGSSQAAVSADSAAASSKSETTPPPASRKYARHSRYWKNYAHRKSGKVALKSSAAGKAGTSDADDSDNLPTIPPSVANANAQFASADTPTSNAARAMSARANDILQAGPANTPPAADGQVVSPDQLNDIDRALRAGTPPANLKLASAEVPAAPTPPPAAPTAASSSSDSSTWDQTSLIGKIFIAFGALLTMASAARMFMA